MKLPLSDAVASAVMGYAVVFSGLVLLMAVILLLGKVMTAKKAAPGPAPAPEPTSAPLPPAPEALGTGGQVKLYSVPDREAAMVMAIVAHRLGKPLNQLRFKSIKEVKEDEI